MQPGGHCDGNPDTLANARREVEEETGLTELRAVGRGEIFDLDVHAVPARERTPRHLHFDVRHLFVTEAGDFSANHESTAIEWVSLEKVQDKNPESSLARMVSKVRSLSLKG